MTKVMKERDQIARILGVGIFFRDKHRFAGSHAGTMVKDRSRACFQVVFQGWPPASGHITW